MKVELEMISKYKHIIPEDNIKDFLFTLKPDQIDRLHNDPKLFFETYNRFATHRLATDNTEKKKFNSVNTQIPIDKTEFLPPQNNFLRQKQSEKNIQFVGLENVGNTCYFNSLLQTLFFIENFRKKILKLKIPEKLSTEIAPRTQTSLNLLKSIQGLFTEMLQARSPTVNPSSVCNGVYNEMNEKVLIGKQQDMVEYLMILIDHMSVGVGYLSDLETQQSTKDNNTLKNESNKNQPNPILLQTQEIIENKSSSINFINELFSGKLVWSLESNVKEKNTTPQNQTKDIEEDFGPLIVNIDEKSLQEALSAKLRYELSGFKPEV